MRRRPPRSTRTDNTLALHDALPICLALFGLGIFGPSIASGLVAGAPQLGAGAAVGTGVELGFPTRIRGQRRVQIVEIGRAHVELQSLMRISYAVFCLKKKIKQHID